MGNVLRGAILSFIWCLIVPHILVFIISMIGTEINKGYISGQIIGGSMMGTALLFILTLFIAFTPLIGAMILTGAGISSAGGIIASMGANYVMNLPKNAFNSAATVFTGGTLGPKMKLASATVGGSYKLASKAKGSIASKFQESSIKKNKNMDVGKQSRNETIKDAQHISEFFKGVQKSIDGSKISQSSKKNVGDIRFKLTDTNNSIQRNEYNKC